MAQTPLEINVQDEGAGDGDPARDTDAFKSAIEKAKSIQGNEQNGGIAVRIPPGRYYIKETIAIQNLILLGTLTPAWGANAGKAVMPTIVPQTPAGQPCIRLEGGGAVHGILFECGSWNGRDQAPVILLFGAGCRVSNVRIDDPYWGIVGGDHSGYYNAPNDDHLTEVGRSVIENCFIVRAVKSGVELGTRHSKTRDVTWVSKVEVWSDAEHVVTEQGFLFGVNDALMVSDCLAHRCETGFKLWQQILPPFGYTWGTFTNCISDACGHGFRIMGNHTVSIVGGSHWSHHGGIVVDQPPGQANLAQVRASGVEFAANGAPAAIIEGARLISLSGCQLRRNPQPQVQQGPVLKVTNDSGAVVDGCVFHLKQGVQAVESPSSPYLKLGTNLEISD